MTYLQKNERTHYDMIHNHKRNYLRNGEFRYWHYLAKLFVLHNSPTETELLFEVPADFLVAELFLQPLHRCQAFLSIPLLNVNMDAFFPSSNCRVIIGHGEWICIQFEFIKT